MLSRANAFHRSSALLTRHHNLLLINSSRQFAIGSILSRVLKLRYVLFGTAVGGGLALGQVSRFVC